MGVRLRWVGSSCNITCETPAWSVNEAGDVTN